MNTFSLSLSFLSLSLSLSLSLFLSLSLSLSLTHTHTLFLLFCAQRQTSRTRMAATIVMPTTYRKVTTLSTPPISNHIVLISLFLFCIRFYSGRSESANCDSSKPAKSNEKSKTAYGGYGVGNALAQVHLLLLLLFMLVCFFNSYFCVVLMLYVCQYVCMLSVPACVRIRVRPSVRQPLRAAAPLARPVGKTSKRWVLMSGCVCIFL